MYVNSLIPEPTESHDTNLSGIVEQKEEIEHVEKEEGEETTVKLDSYDLYKLNMTEVHSNPISSAVQYTYIDSMAERAVDRYS